MIVAVAAMIKRVAKVICSLHQVRDCVRGVALMYTKLLEWACSGTPEYRRRFLTPGSTSVVKHARSGSESPADGGYHHRQRKGADVQHLPRSAVEQRIMHATRRCSKAEAPDARFPACPLTVDDCAAEG